ncbi:IS3 family transposase [Streptomyces sp. NPDC002659]|uniref:IS3 family transposase n=1 Tax=Streptomyces sp. NPDC002659 TaxID=3364656 RepID=UPI0036A0DD49
MSKSGFYDWRSRPLSTAERRDELKVHIHFMFEEFDETYGYRRVHPQLARQGVQVGRELVRALMREPNLVPCQSRPLVGPVPRRRTHRPGARPDAP